MEADAHSFTQIISAVMGYIPLVDGSLSGLRQTHHLSDLEPPLVKQYSLQKKSGENISGSLPGRPDGSSSGLKTASANRPIYALAPRKPAWMIVSDRKDTL